MDWEGNNEFLLENGEEEDEETAASTILPPQSASCWSAWREWWMVKEAWRLFKLAVPVIISQYSQQMLVFISVLFVGHITGKSLELDAAALALSFVTVTALSVGWGLATAGDTLCSQAYGFKNYKRVGVILQRGILILMIAVFPIYIIWLNTESLLLLFQLPPCVAKLSAEYIRIVAFAVPFMFLFQMLQKYLQGQGIVWPLGIVVVFVNIINAVLHAILIFGAEMGLHGSAIALTTSFILLPLLLVAYIWWRGLHHRTWGGWSWESLRDWGQFVRLAVPGLLMVCCEQWCFEISAILTGAIDEVQLGINSVMIQLLSSTFQIPLGLGIAAGVRVGNELGAGNPRGAKRASWTAMAIITVNAVVIGVILLGTKNFIAKIFTEDRDVIEGTAEAMYAGIFVIVFDQLAGATAGILRGSGRHVLGAVLNFFCYYVIGLPVGISLAFAADMGTLGIWIGLALADGLQALSFTLLIVFTDWKKESDKAMKNARSKGEPTVSGMGEGERESGEVEDEERSSVSSQLEDSDIRRLVFTEEEPSIDSNKDACHELPIDNELAVLGEASYSSNSQENLSTYRPQGDESSINKSLLSQTDVFSSHCPSIVCLTAQTRSNLRLLLFRSTFFIVGGVMLIAGGVASLYRPSASVYHGNYSDCTNDQGHSNQSNITSYFM